MAPSKQPPPNPELEHVPDVAERTQAAQTGALAEGELAGLYVTTGVPNLIVEVLPQQAVRAPEGEPEPGDYREGDQFTTHGPTAHMLEARGYVKVIGVSP